MTNTHKKHCLAILGLSSVLGILAFSSSKEEMNVFEKPYAAGEHTASLSALQGSAIRDAAAHPNTQTFRIAQRLQTRLRRRGNKMSPPLVTLEEAVRSRQNLLRASAVVSFTADPAKKPTIWDVSTQRYPLLIKSDFTATTASVMLNREAIEQYIAADAGITERQPENATVTEVHWSDSPKSASRVVIEGIAKGGYVLDPKNASATIATGLRNGETAVSVSLDYVPGKVLNTTGLDLGELTLLSTGRSDFRGSDYARIANVKKALDHHVNNALVATDQVFSFNATLDGPVSQGNGWHMAKVIFNGGDLEYAPGGGICQASTTVYRAALLAGLPVLERKAHSLYVTYYKKFGVGIDATIYPGSQDLTFRNDTGHPLIIQAYHEGTEAYVNIYGTPDGRTAQLDGPYFASTAPLAVKEAAKGISSNEIVWMHTVRMPDGTVRTSEVSSRYKTLPRSLVTEYPAPETILHAAAVAQITD